MQKIIIIGALCVFLALATLGGLKYFEMGPFSKPEDLTNNKQISLKSIFFKVKPVTISVIDSNEIAAKVRINIKLEAKVSEDGQLYQGSLRERQQKKEEMQTHRIEKIMPRIENIFISDLHAFVPRFFIKYDKIDDLILGKRLLTIAERRLEKGLIYGVSATSKVSPPD